MTSFRDGSYNARSTGHGFAPTRGIPHIRSNIVRLVRAPTRPSFVALILVLSSSAHLAIPAFASEAVRTVSQDARGATFEIAPRPARFDSVTQEGVVYARVSVGGAYAADEPGRPALPTLMIPVGVPDGMSARARVVSAEWEDRAGLPPPLPMMKQRFVADDPKSGPVSEERYEPDRAIYGGGEMYPREAVSVGEGGPVGDLWMMPALVRPVRYDAGRGRYAVLKRMTLRAEFVPATARDLRLRPVARPGAEAGAAGWGRVQRSMLRNYDAARAFPRRPAPGALPAPRAPKRVGAGNPEFRIAVTTTGWSAVGYAALAAAGFPSGVAISQIGVWERGYDDVGDSATAMAIPVVARDANTNGLFDAGDAITFYARNLRDRVGPLSIENRYTDANVYWLTWTGAAAAGPDSISGVIADPSPATPTSFRDTIHLEQNRYMLASPSTTVGTPSENVEYFFWTAGTSSDPDPQKPEVFDAPIPFVDVETADPFRIQARYQGSSGWTHRLSIYFQGSSGVTDTLVTDQTFLDTGIYLLDTGFTIPGSHVGGGTNRYTHSGFGLPSGGSTYFGGSRAWLDWVDVTYSRKYLARADALEFTSGSAGGVAELHVTGFTQSTIQVYDITAPTAPLRVTGVAVSYEAVGGTYEAVFRTDAGAGTRRFVALVPGSEAAIAAAAIQRDTPSALGTPAFFPPDAFARAVLIAPEEFLAPANRLADFRRGQGYVVEVATTQDVYDEFNGGIKSAAAIRRYFLHAYRAWTPRPAFAALLGDASMDYRHNLPSSSADRVPTYLAFEGIGGPNGKELVANDAFYVLNLAGGSSAAALVTPGMFLGRVPASGAAELDQYVTKVIQYENFQATDTWRGRQLLLSDDAYSSTIFFNAGYCFQPSEPTFEAASQDMADAAASSLSGSDLASGFFDLKSFTDPLAVTCRDPLNATCRNLLCVVNAFRRIGGAVDSFHSELAKGGLILNVQAHANRYLIAHEQIYNTGFGDLSRIANVGRPNFYMVWACHANQFPDGPSGGSGIDSTDSFGEQWLMLPDRGSIGGLGSSGYELIDTNAAMNSFMADAFFSTPPAPTPPPGAPQQARWILGEIVGQAHVRNANSGSGFLQAMNRTVNLLGDPMIRMDALPPRIFQVTSDGSPFTEGGLLTTDSPTDSLALVADVRDEAGLKRTDLAERPVATGVITPLDSTLFRVAVSDTGRAHTLTAKIRPRIGNYDLLVRSTDTNGREQLFVLQVRSTVRYLANGVVIVNGVFVEGNAVLRAEVTTPIPVTADSLALLLDGSPIVTLPPTQMDATGRRWALVTLPEERGPGNHTLDVAVSGRTGDFAQGSFVVETGFTIRGLAVVSPRLMGSGCDGSVFQFELSAPAPNVELLLMTVSGRRVATLRWPGKAGFNVYCWDGRDSQGHESATGLYFYKLTATDAAGHALSRSGRMIRAR